MHRRLGAIGRGHRERVGNRGANVQIIKSAVGGESPGAGCIDAERAVGANRGALRHKGRRAVHVGDAQSAAGGERSVGFSQHDHGRRQDCWMVEAFDFHGRGGPADCPVTQLNGVSEGVCPDPVRAKILKIGCAGGGHGVRDFAVCRDGNYCTTRAVLHCPNRVLCQ